MKVNNKLMKWFNQKKMKMNLMIKGLIYIGKNENKKLKMILKI